MDPTQIVLSIIAGLTTIVATIAGVWMKRASESTAAENDPWQVMTSFMGLADERITRLEDKLKEEATHSAQQDLAIKDLQDRLTGWHTWYAVLTAEWERLRHLLKAPDPPNE